MLKSHFNIAQNEPEEVEEEVAPYVPRDVERGGDETVVEEEKVIRINRRLNRSEICTKLSFLGKTGDGDGYAYLKAKCVNMGLTDISAIKHFHYLQFVDVSQNNLDLAGLQVVTELPHLLLIHADKNVLTSAALKKTKYLQVMILNNNYITSIFDVFQPELSTFEAGYNKILHVFFQNRMPNLRCLDLRYNIIEDISDINFPVLDSLYLAGNKIKKLNGLERLVNLRILHLRHNPIRSLDGFDAGMSKLQYVNLRNCKVPTLRQIKKLKVLPALDTLILKGCPYMGGTGEESPETAAEEEDAELRIEVLATLQSLKRLNKGIISPEERHEAKDLMMQWLEEGDKEEEEVEEEQEVHEEDERDE